MQLSREDIGRWLGRPELGWLVGVLLVAAALLGFFELADEVREGESRSIDRAVLLAFRDARDPSDPVGPRWVEILFEDLTSLGGVTVLAIIVLASAGYLLADGKRGAALLVLAATGGGALVSTLLKLAFGRARPDVVPHAVEVFTPSFPSGHAMLSAVTYLTLGALLARVQSRLRLKAYLVTVAMLLTLGVGVSRVYLGVHWPTDVLAGWCVGAAWAILCWIVAAWLQRRGTVEGAPPG